MRALSLVLVAIALAPACSPYSPDLGTTPFLCNDTDPKCPENYTCQDGGGGRMVCVLPGGTVSDANADSSNCANDSNLEPNNDITHATQTPLDISKKAIPYSGLAICPAGDKDTFAVTLSTANENIDATLTYDVGGAVLQLSILNSVGGAIGNGSPMGMNVSHANVQTLPAGVYYVQAFGPASGTFTTNNYKLRIVTCPMSNPDCCPVGMTGC
ncbi:MAG: hypothetical protein JWO36_2205 [Myxococcales bacterium]|nr:hypothetical protein [Myxococcales bacterium]